MLHGFGRLACTKPWSKLCDAQIPLCWSHDIIFIGTGKCVLVLHVELLMYFNWTGEIHIEGCKSAGYIIFSLSYKKLGSQWSDTQGACLSCVTSARIVGHIEVLSFCCKELKVSNGYVKIVNKCRVGNIPCPHLYHLLCI